MHTAGAGCDEPSRQCAIYGRWRDCENSITCRWLDIVYQAVASPRSDAYGATSGKIAAIASFVFGSFLRPPCEEVQTPMCKS